MCVAWVRGWGEIGWDGVEVLRWWWWWWWWWWYVCLWRVYVCGVGRGGWGDEGEGGRGVGRVGEKSIPATRNRAMGHDKLKQGSTAFVNVVSCVVYVCRAVIVAYG